MFEIEIKSPVADLGAIRRRLEALNAVHVGSVEQSDTYFAHPCRDFGRTDEALRIRSQGSKEALYYKGPKVDSETKTREEIAVPLTDAEAMRKVLRRLGFVPAAVVEKSRDIYRLDGVEVVLDNVKGLGTFVELEVQGEDIEQGKAVLKEAMSSLCLEGSERRSYLELLMEKD
jgi:adenylate cyclase class 2